MEDDNPERLRTVPPSLKAALRRARIENAEQSEALAETRETEVARLEILEEAIRPVLDQVPDGVDLFDAGIVHGERPRLFIDMIGFVEMAHDRRSYRFVQDTRHGRALIAESERIDRMVAAVANYVARRLVERERALASDWRSRENPPAQGDAARPTRALTSPADGAPARPVAEARGAAPAKARHPRRLRRALADALRLALTALGALVLCAGVVVAAFWFWEAYGQALWSAYLGPPPF